MSRAIRSTAGGRFTASGRAFRGCRLLLAFNLLGDRATVSAPFQGRASATAKDRTSTSASSWREALVPPGGAPTPPEAGVTSPGRRRRASEWRLSHSPRDRLAHLRPRIPLAPSTQRHRLTPLDEQGGDIMYIIRS